MAIIYCDTAGATTANCGLTLDLWKKPILARLAGVTESLVTCELNAAVREFYIRSQAWREQIGPFNVYQDTDLVWLNPVDPYSNVLQVRGAWLQIDNVTYPLEPNTTRVTTPQTGQPMKFSTPDPYVLRLWPTPDKSYLEQLWIDTSLVPLPDATRLPNIASSHHFEPILEGALSRLYAIPNKPWTDPALAMVYLQSFKRRCVQWRDHAGRGYGPADVPFRFPAFA